MKETPQYYWIKPAYEDEWYLARPNRGAGDQRFWILMETGVQFLEQDRPIEQTVPVFGPHAPTLPQSWRDAPEWANWLAQDSDGSWHFHEECPRIVEAIHSRFWENEGRNEWAVSSRNYIGPKYRRPE